MSDFRNAPAPHGAVFDDVPRQPYHVTDAAMLRSAYGPAAVPIGDPSDEDYTWTEQAAPAGLAEAGPTEVDRRLAEIDTHMAVLFADLRALQADVRNLQTIVHRLLNVGEEPDAE